MKREVAKMMIRIPPPMKAWLEEQAEKNYNSANSQVTRIIARAMEAEKQSAARVD